MHGWLNLPNTLTLFRLLLVPVTIQAILSRHHTAAILIFAAAALTDFADGALARRYGWITVAGAYLDPIADKLLLSSVFVCLAIVGSVPRWFVGLVLVRDILLLASSAAALAYTTMRRFPPSIWGKASTALQILTAVAWMAANACASPALERFAAALIWPTAAVTAWSGLHYCWRGAQRYFGSETR